MIILKKVIRIPKRFYNPGHVRPISCKSPWHALLVGDLHLSNGYAGKDRVKASERTLAALEQVFRNEQTHQLFILGDLFHSNCGDATYRAHVYDRLQAISAEKILILGGNHDRPYFQQEWSIGSITGVPEEFLQLYSSRGESLWLTHDGGNPIWLSVVEVVPFLRALRSVNHLPAGNWMIAAHAHHPTCLPDEKLACVGNFNLAGEHPRLSYGVFKDDQGTFTFDLKAGSYEK